MSMEAFLVSMQASGAIFDNIQTRRNIAMSRAGHEVEMAQLNTRLEEERLAAAQQSLSAMQQLRGVLASQRAMFAARGQAGGKGTAFAISQESVRGEKEDARIRRMNLLTRESSLRSAGVLSGMHQLASETRLGQALSQRMWDQIPFAELGQRVDRFFSTPGQKMTNRTETA